MINAVTLKADGAVTQLEDTGAIRLDAPSVVTLGFGPEEVAKFDKVGNDLVLTLHDGSRVVIADFFVMYDEGRNDIVFVDENEVVWWGQYDEPWRCFEIAEIENELLAAAIVPPTGSSPLLGLLAGAGLLGAIASALRADEPNNPPVSGNDAADVVEAGFVEGGNDPTLGVPETQGNVLANASDADGDPLTVTSIRVNGVQGAIDTPLAGTYGELVMGADGTYTYTLDNDLPATQALNFEDVVTEVFTYTVSDGNGGTTTATLTVSVQGTNDLPVVSGVDTGAVEEDGVQTATGQLLVDDVDQGDAHVWSINDTTAVSYGNFGVNVDGIWTYQLDNTLPEVQALGEGDILTDTVLIRATDSAGGWTEQLVTVTITGSNDAPVIDAAASNLAGSVTEIADLAPGENVDQVTATGTIAFSDVDGDLPVATAVPVVNDGSYLGDLTFEPAAGGSVTWNFAVDDALLDSLPEGTVLTQEYVVTLTDEDGGTATETVTITLVGSNDAPLTEDDTSLIAVGQTAVLDVTANDTDIDTGDEANLTVTAVDGQPISFGNPVTLTDGSGVVSIDGNGALSFVPTPGFTGPAAISYTVDDGSGAGNATATGEWVINVVDAMILDNAGPTAGDPIDDVLASVDDLTNVAITGTAPEGTIITSLIVTDENNNTFTLPIDPANPIVVDPSGTYSIPTDVSGLIDGTLTVAVSLEDVNGNTATVTDTILKDTVTSVVIDPVTITDGIAPTITGTAQPGDTVTINIDGAGPVAVVVEADGSWSYTPPTPLGTDEVSIVAIATDVYGNTATDDRLVAGAVPEDQAPADTQNITVNEAGLPAGTDPTSGSDAVVATLDIGTSEVGLTEVVIAGETITLAQLENVAVTPIPPISTEYGTINVTGYDPITDIVTYEYTLDGNSLDNVNGAGVPSENDILTDSIAISVVDADGDTRATALEVAVVDDVPLIGTNPSDPVSVTSSDASLGVDPSADFSVLFAVDHGADGAADTVYTLEVSSAGVDSGVTDAATGQPILLFVEAGVIVGRVGDQTGPAAFTVAVDAGTGAVTLDQLSALSHPIGTDTISLVSDAAVLRVTATDGDGDTETQVAEIGGRLNFTDDVPTVTATPDGAVDEAGLRVPGATVTASGDLNIDFGADRDAAPVGVTFDAAQADLAALGLSSGGVALVYVITDGVITATAGAGGATVFTAELTQPTAGNGYQASYDFTQFAPLDHGDAAAPVATLDLPFAITASDGDSDTAPVSLTVTVTDDVPTAVAQDPATVVEGAAAIGSGNGGANLLANDTVGADDALVHQVQYLDDAGATQTAVIAGGTTGPLDTQYGTLTVLDDGTWTFTPDASATHTAGAPLDASFSYTVIDTDGDISAFVAQPITVTDTGPVAVDDTLSVPADTFTPLGGNVVTGPGTDTPGPDGASVTAVTFGGTTVVVPVTGVATIMGQYGTLTLAADGTYTYTRDTGTPGDVDDAFTYTLTDGDGDAVTAVLTVSIGDAPVSIGDLADDTATSDVVVNESKLGDGTGVGAEDFSATGTFTVTSPDGFAELSIAAGAASIDVVSGGVVATTPLTLTSALGSTLTVTGFDAATGVVSYTYTLADGVTHDDAGRDALLDAFAISVTDLDGDVAAETLNVRVLDDAPVVTVDPSAPVSVTSSDASLGVDPSADFSVLFAVDHGADGAAASADTVYTLEVSSAGVDSGVTDAATGQPILLFVEAGVIVGRVGDQTGPAAFTVAVDAGTGAVTLDQLSALSHPIGTDTISLVSDAAVLRVTATDGDGDTETQVAEIGGRLNFTDDVPVTELVADAGFVLPPLGTQDADTLAGDDTATADFSGAFTLTNDLGNDGTGTTGSEVLTYDLALLGDATSVPSGLSSEGDPVTLYLIGGEVFGSTATDAGSVSPANTAFTIATTDAGVVSLTQSAPIDHADDANNADLAGLAANLVSLTAASTVTDADGDTASATASVDIGASFTFTDTGPTVIATPDGAVDEVDLRVPGATITASGDFNIDFGADRDAAPVGVTFDAVQADLAALGLSSGGVALVYVITDGVITATAGAGGATVFTAELTQPTAGNGYQASYDFTQFAPLDHGDAAAPVATLDLPFAITASDGDSDTAPVSLTVTVTDDVPTAVAQDPATVVEGAAAIGSGNGGANLLANDTVGADDALVHQVQYLDDAGATQTAVIAGGTTGPLDTQYGTLTVLDDGTWTFTPDASATHTAGAPLDASFSYTVIDTDGDISAFVAQPITVTDTGPVAVNDPAATLVEGGADGTGNVIGNDTASADGGTVVDSFTYTNAAGVETTFTFTDGGPTTTTVATPTGDLTVQTDGSWTFAQADSFDHDATGADQTSGTFSYVLSDADGSLSDPATQVISVEDTDPVSTAASFSLDEADLPTGSAMGAANPTVTTSLAIVTGADEIAGTVFTAATIAGLPTLSSGGEALEYTLSPDGYTLTATTETSGTDIFTLVIDNPTDATGASQSITATLLGPIDQAGSTLSLLNVGYEVRDIDSAIQGNAAFVIADDTPLTPVNDTPITVVEGGAADGSATSGDNLLTNDETGADATGLVYDFTYTDRSGATVTALVAVAGTTMDTQYGTLTVQQNGDWTYTAIPTADHVQPSNDLDLSDDFTYRTIDSDGDISGASATQGITVLDTVPEIGTPENVTVDEANLPTGSDPMAGGLTQTGSLDLVQGQDTFDTTITGLPTGLTSDGVVIEYVTQPDGHGVIAYAGPGRTVADQVFTVDLTDPTTAGAGYSFELFAALDEGTATSIDLTFGVTMTDSDGDTDQDSFIVSLLDDSPPNAIPATVDEDGSISIATTADATPTNTSITQNGVTLVGAPDGSGGVVYTTDNGTVTVLADGSIVYEPADNFSGEEIFEFVIDDNGVPTTTTVTATVTPVSDAPTMTVDVANVNTLEDTAVALGLNAPVITDDATGTGNNPTTERLGLITLTGLPEDAVLSGTGTGLPFTVTTAPVTVAISDLPLITGATGADLVLTTAEYEALTVTPPLHTSEEFTITATVSSFEVDGADNPIAGVAGAEQTAEVIVDVEAVTDNAELVFDTTATTVPNVTTITYASTTEATARIDEDTTFNLSSVLTATFADLDESEVRSITITNDSLQDIVVNGTTVAAGGGTITLDDLAGASGQTGGIDSFADILIGAGANISGELDGIQVTINTQDVDSDGYLVAGVQSASPFDGVAEADTTDNTVTLNLEVTPVAGDVTVADSTGAEDTPIAFLAGVAVNDGSSGAAGSETMTVVSFARPTADWTVTEPVIVGGATWTIVESGTDYTINFTGGTQAEREAALDAFTITPPAHSSLDATVTLSVTTEDSVTINGVVEVATQTSTQDILIEVTPVAEVIDTGAAGDTDDNGTPDLSMNPDYTYTGTEQGAEDAWFALNQPGFDFTAGWSNEDTDEIGAVTDNTYARITPEVTSGDPAGVDGSQFRWTDSGGTVQTATFNGTAIDIPVSALGSVEFLPAENFSGQIQFNVTAYTEDFDDDAEGTGTPDTAESGGAVLTNLIVLPVADPVALTLTAVVNADEDTVTPLFIRPSSPDPTETFNIEITGIPDGAVVTYNGSDLTITAGVVQIIDFDDSLPLSITPPPDSNDNFDLVVNATSVDTVTVDGTTFTNESPVATLGINLNVKGVADVGSVTATPQTYVEADLDGNTDAVAFADVVTVALQDTDAGDPGGPSETLSVRVSGLPDGFSMSEGALVSPPSATGVDRVWSLTEANLATAQVNTPNNASGLVEFTVEAVTTENDGDAIIGAPETVSFTITPSPEAATTTSAVLVEDVVTSLNFGINYQNGDTDETITGVRILVSEAVGSDYTLYLGTGPGAVLLSSLTPTVGDPAFAGGADYYQLTPAQAATLSALAEEHVDGPLSSFQIFYEITDAAFAADQPSGTGATSTPVVSDYQVTTFGLSATPVTDQPDATITSITGSASSTITDEATGDDATPDTVSVSGTDTLTVTMNVASPDMDGSERVVRVLIDNVPIGVTVEGAQIVGPNNWLLVYEGPATPQIGPNVDIPVVFVITDQFFGAGGVIDMTAQVQDRGDGTPSTSILSDTVSWTLESTIMSSNPTEFPADIVLWEYSNTDATEDAPFTLADVLNATVNALSDGNTLTVQLIDLPPGTDVTGMTVTTINGVETWTASTTATAADAQTALDALLASVTLTTPPDANGNTAPFPFNATLTTSVVGGATVQSDNVDTDIPIVPVVDEAAFDIVIGQNGTVLESENDIPFTVTVTNNPDGAFGSIVNGDLYLTVDVADPTAAPVNGVLTSGDGLTTYTLQTISGDPLIPDGDYYVIPGVDYGTEVDLSFAPDTLGLGTITVDALVVNSEVGDPVSILSTGTEAQPIGADNNGVVVTTAPSAGNELVDSDPTTAIQLQGLTVALNDDDGSEDYVSILLSNVPDGFLVVTGADAASATAASNAGGSGGLSTWVLTGAGEELPAFVGILPPANWSGTVTGLELFVTTNDVGASDNLTDTQVLDDVTVDPVANGVVLDATSTFGDENAIVPFNFNIAIVDVLDTSILPQAPDAHQETATLQVAGLGAFASIYVGTTQLIDGVSYDAGSDTYTIAGLSQAQIDTLGFVQAVDAFTDQDGATAGTQLEITAFTVDASTTVPTTSTSASETTTLTLEVTEQAATGGDDSLLWTGSAIDGLAGVDTVAIRNDESLTGAVLAANLTNVETLDLGIAGVNNLDSVSAAQVQTMTDDNNMLTITGTADDTVTLSSDWSETDPNVYTSIVGTDLITLTIAGGVQASIAPPPMMMMSSFAAPAPFNLAQFDAEPPADEKPADPAPLNLSLNDVMEDPSQEDLGALLPEPSEPAATPTSPTGEETQPTDTSGGGVAPSNPWDEDPQDGLVFES